MSGFFKLSGSGNDFLALADPEGSAPAPGREQIRAWCRRGVSLGADGLFLLRRRGDEAAMEYWNADGLPADLCLNGTRCAAQLAFHLGWAHDRVRIATAAGSVAARQLDPERIALDLPVPLAAGNEPRELSLDALGKTWTGWAITVGVPHLVLPWPESLAGAPVVPLGRALRHHPAFAPAGTNVDFVRFPKSDRMEIRTYERGVEDETLSCGTGILAGAAVGLHLKRATLPLSVLTQGGFELAVTGDPADPAAGTGKWSLAGDARIVAQGDLLAAAAVEPTPPAWS
ncbi:MAG TPA: diaminopimelate epimerase [Thermoanaerobaculia bacterium]|nr:diaminopimelate epimerase [Thermoanaerobaculia bacterium]